MSNAGVKTVTVQVDLPDADEYCANCKFKSAKWNVYSSATCLLFGGLLSNDDDGRPLKNSKCVILTLGK